MVGYVMFELGDREFACRLDEVREVVRLEELDHLPGMVPPVSGVLELRGAPLPVVDLRTEAADGARRGHGDVLVLAEGIDALGIAVDRVLAIRATEDLVPSGDERPASLPDYVVAVMRRRTGGAPLLLVDLRSLAGLSSAAVPATA